MPDPSSRGWGPGWPNCQTNKVKTLVRPDGLRLPVRVEIMEMVAWLLDETERRGYDIRPGETWCYACRQIRGSTKPSYHSWALSLDLNAPANPMLYGKPGWQWLHDHGRTDMPKWLPDLWKAHMFGWGGDYPNRQDAMHLEFMGSPADAARITRELKAGTAPVTVGRGLPIRLAKGTQADPYQANWLIAHLQEDLLVWGSRNPRAALGLRPLGKDAVYGPTTASWVVAFKRWVIDFQKAFRMPVWPNDDTNVGNLTWGTLQFWTS